MFCQKCEFKVKTSFVYNYELFLGWSLAGKPGQSSPVRTGKEASSQNFSFTVLTRELGQYKEGLSFYDNLFRLCFSPFRVFAVNLGHNSHQLSSLMMKFFHAEQFFSRYLTKKTMSK